MKLFLTILLFSILGVFFLQSSQDKNLPLSHIQSDTLDLKDYQWKNRLILLFTPSLENPLYQKQVKAFQSKLEDIKERDLLIFHFSEEEQKYQKSNFLSKTISRTYLKHFNLKKGQFYILLIGKDGGVKYQSKNFTLPSKIFQLIDSMPMRQAEMKN